MIMGSGFDDWIYWRFFTITVDYNSSHNELLLNNISLMNLSEESLTNLSLLSTLSNSRMHCPLQLLRGRDRSHHVQQFLCSVVLSRECPC
jgi:hypothetical protein